MTTTESELLAELLDLSHSEVTCKGTALLFLLGDNAAAARIGASELARRLTPLAPLPLYVIHGDEHALHHELLAGEMDVYWEHRAQLGFTRENDPAVSIPIKVPMVLLVEHFDRIPGALQRDYAHLADGERQGLQRGSVLLLHVADDRTSEIEAGTRDRGLWLHLPS